MYRTEAPPSTLIWKFGIIYTLDKFKMGPKSNESRIERRVDLSFREDKI